MKFKEILGYPAAGKSTFRKKLAKNRKIFSLEEIFFKNLFLNTSIFKTFFYKILYIFFKNKKFSDLIFEHYLSKKNNFILSLKNIIKSNVKDFEKDNKFLFNNYLDLIEITSYSKLRKKRNIKRFEFFLGMYNFVILNKNIKRFNFEIIQDEGFYQKIFLDYKNDNFDTLSKIKKYLNSIPPVDKVYFIEEDLDICIKRMKLRNKYFNFSNEIVGRNIFKKIKKLIDIKNKKIFIRICSKNVFF